MNTFQILTSKFRFDLMHWNVSIDADKWPIFGRFLTLFPLKRPARCKKIPPIWRTSVDDVMDDVTCRWRHVQVLHRAGRKLRHWPQFLLTENICQPCTVLCAWSRSNHARGYIISAAGGRTDPYRQTAGTKLWLVIIVYCLWFTREELLTWQSYPLFYVAYLNRFDPLWY
jgi:hypothetical protein